MALLDERTESLAARTKRLAQLLEVQTAVRPSGNDRESIGEIISFPAGPWSVRWNPPPDPHA